MINRYVTNNRTYDRQVQWRMEDASRYLATFQRTVSFEGKAVLDFACGYGGIADAFRVLARPRQIIGVDANLDMIRFGQRAFPETDLRHAPKNQTGLDDASMDIVYSTDAFEHFEAPTEVLTELYRTLKPGGYLLIYFIPWWSVEGAHLEGVIPIPWCQVLFSGRTLHRTARRVTRADFYTPLAWDYDEAGTRRYPFDDQDDFDPAWLNRITIRRFKRYVALFTRDGRMEVVDFTLAGFSGTTHPWARSFAWMSRVPGIKEFANRGVYCSLRKLQ
jgi:SAM-dependent methyltransferase